MLKVPFFVEDKETSFIDRRRPDFFLKILEMGIDVLGSDRAHFILRLQIHNKFINYVD